MAEIIVGILTGILVLDCVILGFLILLQLPKKEAGLGTAFGGGATDLFGAGTGDVLTNATKYAASIFIVLSFGLSVWGSHHAAAGKLKFQQTLQSTASKQVMQFPATPANSTNADAAKVLDAINRGIAAQTNTAKPATPAVAPTATNAPAKK